MGNRAVITTEEDLKNNGVGVYVHWNGGRDSVEMFLKYCKIRGFRCPEEDCYGWARLTQVIANFMGGDGLSVGIDKIERLDADNYDNGVYIIKGWEIVGRKYFNGKEQNEGMTAQDLEDSVVELDKDQPVSQQIGERLIRELIATDKTLSNIASDYFYSIRKSKDEVRPFNVGEGYGKVQDGLSEFIIQSRTDDEITVKYKSGKIAVHKVYHWKNGQESVISCATHDFGGRTYYSTVLS